MRHEATSPASEDAAPLGTAAEFGFLWPPPSRTGRNGRPILSLRLAGGEKSEIVEPQGPAGAMQNINLNTATRARNIGENCR
jgi:hypothetical protein